MPVFKFKSLDEAEKSLWNFKPDDQYFRRVANLWMFANQLSDIKYPGGIFKFKTIEDANRHREELELERAIMKQSKRKTEQAGGLRS